MPVLQSRCTDATSTQYLSSPSLSVPATAQNNMCNSHGGRRPDSKDSTNIGGDASNVVEGNMMSLQRKRSRSPDGMQNKEGIDEERRERTILPPGVETTTSNVQNSAESTCNDPADNKPNHFSLDQNSNSCLERKGRGEEDAEVGRRRYRDSRYRDHERRSSRERDRRSSKEREDRRDRDEKRLRHQQRENRGRSGHRDEERREQSRKRRDTSLSSSSREHGNDQTLSRPRDHRKKRKVPKPSPFPAAPPPPPSRSSTDTAVMQEKEVEAQEAGLAAAPLCSAAEATETVLPGEPLSKSSPASATIVKAVQTATALPTKSTTAIADIKANSGISKTVATTNECIMTGNSASAAKPSPLSFVKKWTGMAASKPSSMAFRMASKKASVEVATVRTNSVEKNFRAVFPKEPPKSNDDNKGNSHSSLLQQDDVTKVTAASSIASSGTTSAVVAVDGHLAEFRHLDDRNGKNKVLPPPPAFVDYSNGVTPDWTEISTESATNSVVGEHCYVLPTNTRIAAAVSVPIADTKTTKALVPSGGAPMASSPPSVVTGVPMEVQTTIPTASTTINNASFAPDMNAPDVSVLSRNDDKSKSISKIALAGELQKPEKLAVKQESSLPSSTPASSSLLMSLVPRRKSAPTNLSEKNLQRKSFLSTSSEKAESQLLSVPKKALSPKASPKKKLSPPHEKQRLPTLATVQSSDENQVAAVTLGEIPKKVLKSKEGTGEILAIKPAMPHQTVKSVSSNLDSPTISLNIPRKKSHQKTAVSSECLRPDQDSIKDQPDAQVKIPPETPKDIADPSELVTIGSRVSVYWDGENDWYDGTVTDERPEKKKRFFLEYDDGDTEWINFRKADFKLLSVPGIDDFRVMCSKKKATESESPQTPEDQVPAVETKKGSKKRMLAEVKAELQQKNAAKVLSNTKDEPPAKKPKRPRTVGGDEHPGKMIDTTTPKCIERSGFVEESKLSSDATASLVPRKTKTKSKAASVESLRQSVDVGVNDNLCKIAKNDTASKKINPGERSVITEKSGENGRNNDVDRKEEKPSKPRPVRAIQDDSDSETDTKDGVVSVVADGMKAKSNRRVIREENEFEDELKPTSRDSTKSAMKEKANRVVGSEIDSKKLLNDTMITQTKDSKMPKVKKSTPRHATDESRSEKTTYDDNNVGRENNGSERGAERVDELLKPTKPVAVRTPEMNSSTIRSGCKKPPKKSFLHKKDASSCVDVHHAMQPRSRSIQTMPLDKDGDEASPTLKQAVKKAHEKVQNEEYVADKVFGESHGTEPSARDDEANLQRLRKKIKDKKAIKQKSERSGSRIENSEIKDREIQNDAGVGAPVKSLSDAKVDVVDNSAKVGELTIGSPAVNNPNLKRLAKKAKRKDKIQEDSQLTKRDGEKCMSEQPRQTKGARTSDDARDPFEEAVNGRERGNLQTPGNKRDTVVGVQWESKIDSADEIARNAEAQGDIYIKPARPEVPTAPRVSTKRLGESTEVEEKRNEKVASPTFKKKLLRRRSMEELVETAQPSGGGDEKADGELKHPSASAEPPQAMPSDTYCLSALSTADDDWVTAGLKHDESDDGSDADSETDEEELFAYAQTMFGVRPQVGQQSVVVAAPDVEPQPDVAKESDTIAKIESKPDDTFDFGQWQIPISEAVKLGRRKRSMTGQAGTPTSPTKLKGKVTKRVSLATTSVEFQDPPRTKSTSDKTTKSAVTRHAKVSPIADGLVEQDEKLQREAQEARRKKEEAKPLTAADIRAILGDDCVTDDCSQHWVRRSARQPSKSCLESPKVQALLQKLRNNDEDMVVLKMKKYVSDPAAPTLVLDAVLDALDENTNCEALYIQNFNEGMRDEQVLHLLRILQQPSCKIWCLNIGETYKVKRKTWKAFVKGLQHTKVTHMYASEHTISAELKEKIRATIRDNRSKHNMHIDPNNLDVIVRCTHCWWNPINAKVLRPYIKKKGYEAILYDAEAQGLRGTHSGESLL